MADEPQPQPQQAPQNQRKTHSRMGRPPGGGLAWTPDAEAAILRFWAGRGALLEKHQRAASPRAAMLHQRRRSRIVMWARKHVWHRNPGYLEQQMAAWDAAAAEAGWEGDVNAAALDSCSAVTRDPLRLMQRLRRLETTLSGLGLGCSDVLRLARSLPRTLERRLPSVLATISAWPISIDPAFLLAKAPALLQAPHLGVYRRRILALQQLHPQLDVARVVRRSPTLLQLPAATMAAQWQRLQAELGLSSDQAQRVAEYDSTLLHRNLGLAGRKLTLIRAFDAQRLAAGQPPPKLAAAFPSWVVNTLNVSGVAMLRLSYLSERAAAGEVAALTKPGYTIVRQPKALFDTAWPGFSSWCIDMMHDTK